MGNVLLLFIGVFACSTAVIMIIKSALDPMLISAYRLLAAVVLLSPFFVRDYQAARPRLTFAALLRRALVPGLLLGGHFILWVIGARLTPPANSSLVVNMTPVVMPFCLYLLVRERIDGVELVGTALAVAGVIVLGVTDFKLSAEYFKGDAFCVASMLFFVLYLALGRRASRGLALWLYVAPLYLVGGLLCLVCGLISGADPLSALSAREALLVLGLALVPTMIGHSSLNFCMRKMRGQAVAIGNLGQFVFAGILGYFILSEVPDPAFYVAAVLVVAGSVVVLEVPEATVVGVTVTGAVTTVVATGTVVLIVAAPAEPPPEAVSLGVTRRNTPNKPAARRVMKMVRP